MLIKQVHRGMDRRIVDRRVVELEFRFQRGSVVIILLVINIDYFIIRFSEK